MFKIVARVILGAILTAVLFAEPQQGRIITITAGTAIRLILNPNSTNPVMANSMMIQPIHGGSGLVYVLNANPQQTCSMGNGNTTEVAELSAASTSSPGVAFTFPSNGAATTYSSGFDVRYWCIDGANSGDQVLVSWDLRSTN